MDRPRAGCPECADGEEQENALRKAVRKDQSASGETVEHEDAAGRDGRPNQGVSQAVERQHEQDGGERVGNLRRPLQLLRLREAGIVRQDAGNGVNGDGIARMPSSVADDFLPGFSLQPPGVMEEGDTVARA